MHLVWSIVGVQQWLDPNQPARIIFSTWQTVQLVAQQEKESVREEEEDKDYHTHHCQSKVPRL